MLCARYSEATRFPEACGPAPMAATDADSMGYPSARAPPSSGLTSPAHSSAAPRLNSVVSRESSASYLLNPFGFEAKTSQDAKEGLLRSRSSRFAPRPPTVDNDIWRRPPPDFRPQEYAPRPPKRNSRAAVRPWRYRARYEDEDEEADEDGERRAAVKLPTILQTKPEAESEFVTAFQIPGSWEAKLLSVSEGTHPAGEYVQPRPHDFRGYPPIASLGLPEFETKHDHDPYNIKFNSQRLRIHHGLNTTPPGERGGGRQMAPPIPEPPEWEARLILPKQGFPNKYTAYTRYRRFPRTAHSALMERVEDTLSARWAKEQLDRRLRTADTAPRAAPLTTRGESTLGFNTPILTPQYTHTAPAHTTPHPGRSRTGSIEEE